MSDPVTGVVLETPRLLLRRLARDDASFMLALLNDPAFLRYIGDRGVRTTADAARYIEAGPVASYRRFGFGLYAVTRKDDGEPIGICGPVQRDTLPEPDLGFAYLPEFRARGYGFEAATAVLAHAREPGCLPRVASLDDNRAVTASTAHRPLLGRLWSSDYGLHLLLISLLIAMFVAPALVAARMLHPVAVDLFFSLVVISGVMAVARRRVPVFTILFALLTITVRWAHLGLPTRTLAVADGTFSGVMIATLATLILAQVFRAGPVTMHRIEGAVAVYLLVGVLWGNAYRVVSLLLPGAFMAAGGPVTDPASLYYFSFVTLTTVGYGDIAPAVQASRGLAMMEALIGQLYPSILIARLVSLQIVASGHVRPESPGSEHDGHDAA